MASDKQFIVRVMQSYLGSNYEFLVSFWRYFTSGGVVKILGVIAVPFYASLMSPSEYGYVAVFLSYTAIFTILFQLNISGSIRNTYLQSKIAGTNMFIPALFLVGAANVIFATVIIAVGEYIYLPFQRHGLWLFLLTVVLASCKSIYFALLLGLNNSKLYRFYSIISFLIEVLTSLLLFYFLTDNSLARIIAIMLSNTLFPFVILKIVRKNFYYKIKEAISPHLSGILTFSLPLIPHQLGHILLSQMDRIQLGSMYGNEIVGIYSFGYSLAIISQLFVVAYNNATLPRLYSALRHGSLRYVVRSDSIFSFFIFSGSVLIMYLMPLLISVFASMSYIESKSYAIILSIVPLVYFIYLRYVNIMLYSNKTVAVAAGTTLAAVMNFTLNYYLLDLGPIMATYTTVWSYSCLALYQMIAVKVVRRDLKYGFNGSLFILILANAIVLCI